jgi:hypothetical protein
MADDSPATIPAETAHLRPGHQSGSKGSTGHLQRPCAAKKTTKTRIICLTDCGKQCNSVGKSASKTSRPGGVTDGPIGLIVLVNPFIFFLIFSGKLR